MSAYSSIRQHTAAYVSYIRIQQRLVHAAHRACQHLRAFVGPLGSGGHEVTREEELMELAEVRMP